MSKIDYQALREVAEKATPGNWWIDSHGQAMVSFIDNEVLEIFATDNKRDAVRHEDTGNLSRWRNDNDATFIATANPATVLALLGELEAAEKRIAELEAEPVSQTYKLNELSGNSPVTPDGWISCSDRMPEDTKMLLAFSQGEIVAAYWNWVVNPIDYKKYRAFTYLSGNILDDVTHWMPLPEPPL
ncbi:ead/Ea22-like family protein [Escherichia coli]|uniref:ead/Ea22-like family protein n=1 Tax=Escherichia coli TaxID=562 RepID=UPI003D942B79